MKCPAQLCALPGALSGGSAAAGGAPANIPAIIAAAANHSLACFMFVTACSGDRPLHLLLTGDNANTRRRLGPAPATTRAGRPWADAPSENRCETAAFGRVIGLSSDGRSDGRTACSNGGPARPARTRRQPLVTLRDSQRHYLASGITWGLGPNSASPTVARPMLSVQPTCMPRVGPCANRCRAGRPLGQGRASRRAASERMGHWPGTIGPVGNDRGGRVELGSCTVWKETPATYSSRMTPGLVACSRKPRRERRASAGTSSELAVTSGIAECARTTDQLRTKTSALGKHQRSTVDAGEKAFTLSHCHAPIWGSRGREFKSRQPDCRKWL